MKRKIMYLEELTQHPENKTLLGKRNLVKFRNSIYDLIFHGTPAQIFQKINPNDLIIPIIPENENLREFAKSIIDNLPEIDTYAITKNQKYKIVICSKEPSGIKASEPQTAIIREDSLKKYSEKISKFRKEFQITYP